MSEREAGIKEPRHAHPTSELVKAGSEHNNESPGALREHTAEQGGAAYEDQAHGDGRTPSETKLDIHDASETSTGRSPLTWLRRLWSPEVVGVAVEKRKIMNNPQITISEPVASPSKMAAMPRRCPIYYGIRSYIRDFYDPPDNELLKDGDFVQDDFRFMVEPSKRRGFGRWVRVGVVLSVNLMLLGLIALLTAEMAPQRKTVVHQQDNYTVVDRFAVLFNERLVYCQVAGLLMFACGTAMLMVALLLYSYDDYSDLYIVSPHVHETQMQAAGLTRIPLTESVRGVQPTFDKTG